MTLLYCDTSVAVSVLSWYYIICKPLITFSKENSKEKKFFFQVKKIASHLILYLFLCFDNIYVVDVHIVLGHTTKQLCKKKYNNY